MDLLKGKLFAFHCMEIMIPLKQKENRNKNAVHGGNDLPYNRNSLVQGLRGPDRSPIHF